MKYQLQSFWTTQSLDYTPADARIYWFSDQPWHKTEEEAVQAELSETTSPQRRERFAPLVQTQLAPQNFKRLGNSYGHHSSYESWKESSLLLQLPQKEVVLEVSVGRIVKESIEGFSTQGGAQSLDVLPQRTPHDVFNLFHDALGVHAFHSSF